MRKIVVYDERFGLPKHIHTHERVPEEWTTDETLKRLGIGKHLRVYELLDGYSRSIQPYQEWPARA